MATVPGPDPDRPLPKPFAPAVEPDYEPEEERLATPSENRPSWLPEPFDPAREVEEPSTPVGVP